MFAISLDREKTDLEGVGHMYVSGPRFRLSKVGERPLWPGTPKGEGKQRNRYMCSSLQLRKVYSQLHYNLLLMGEAENDINVFRMASATPSGCTCGTRCPPLATLWIEALLPLNEFFCMSHLTEVGLTAKSAALEGERRIRLIGLTCNRR